MDDLDRKLLQLHRSVERKVALRRSTGGPSQRGDGDLGAQALPSSHFRPTAETAAGAKIVAKPAEPIWRTVASRFFSRFQA